MVGKRGGGGGVNVFSEPREQERVKGVSKAYQILLIYLAK